MPMQSRQKSVPRTRATRRSLREEKSFAIETTLSGSWTTSAVKAARDNGFFVRLIYLCVDSPERNIQGVRERVAQGGHHIPDQDVRRRYTRSLLNAAKLIQVVDQAQIYDNSGTEPLFILEIRSGIVLASAPDLPAWAKPLLTPSPL